MGHMPRISVTRRLHRPLVHWFRQVSPRSVKSWEGSARFPPGSRLVRSKFCLRKTHPFRLCLLSQAPLLGFPKISPPSFPTTASTPAIGSGLPLPFALACRYQLAGLVPPSWFLTTWTVSSAVRLTGLLHPASDHGVRRVPGPYRAVASASARWYSPATPDPSEYILVRSRSSCFHVLPSSYPPVVHRSDATRLQGFIPRYGSTAHASPFSSRVRSTPLGFFLIPTRLSFTETQAVPVPLCHRPERFRPYSGCAFLPGSPHGVQTLPLPIHQRPKSDWAEPRTHMTAWGMRRLYEVEVTSTNQIPFPFEKGADGTWYLRCYNECRRSRRTPKASP